MRNAIVAVTGAAGAGKDYLAEAVAANSSVRRINMGTIIGSIVGSDRDRMMEQLSPSDIRAAQLQAYRQVVGHQPALVTCHTVLPRNGELRYDPDLERILDPLHYVFVTAPPDLIAERVHARNERGERQVVERSVGQIATEQEVKLGVVQDLCQKLGCSLLVLNNVSAELDINLTNLALLIDRTEEYFAATPDLSLPDA